MIIRFGLTSAMTCVLAAWAVVALTAQDDSKPVPSSRPHVVAKLKSGQQVEGVLHRFENGRYSLVAGDRARLFHESELESISFQRRRLAVAAPPDYDRWTTEELVEAFAHPGERLSADRRQQGDPALVRPLARRGGEAVRPLLDAVAENSHLTRYASEVLQELGPEHFPAAMELLRNGHRGAFEPLLTAMYNTGVQAAPLLGKLLEFDDVKVRSRALHVLYNIGIQSGTVLPESLTPQLLQAMNDPQFEVRKQTPALLAMVGRPVDDMLPALLDTLAPDSPSGDLAYPTILALRPLASKLPAEDARRSRIETAIVAAMRHAGANIRSQAAGFYYYGDSSLSVDARDALLRLSDDVDDYTRDLARQALRKHGVSPSRASDIAVLKGKSDTEVVAMLASEDQVAVANAVRVLSAREPSAELLQSLMTLVAKDTESGHWNHAANVISGWGDEAAPWLTAYADSSNALVRRVVALGLGRIRIRQFPVALEALSADPDLFVRAAAVESVGAIAENASGPTFDTAVSLLVKRLEEQSIPQYNLRHSSVRSLESIAASHPEQISIIIRWASEAAHKEFRREMLSSLGNVAKRMRADSAEAKLILDALIERLGVERQLEIRVAIVHALGVIPGKPASAERALQSVLDEPQEEIVRAARSLLKNWRRPTVEPDR